MEERIKLLRKALELTQSELGTRIGVKGNTITNYEAGLRRPSEAVLKSICREFNVNETWLRTGEGEMFIKISADDEISELIGGMLFDESPSFKKRLIVALARLDEREWEALEKLTQNLKDDLD